MFESNTNANALIVHRFFWVAVEERYLLEIINHIFQLSLKEIIRIHTICEKVTRRGNYTV